jgi:hypothetical protein
VPARLDALHYHRVDACRSCGLRFVDRAHLDEDPYTSAARMLNVGRRVAPEEHNGPHMLGDNSSDLVSQERPILVSLLRND